MYVIDCFSYDYPETAMGHKRIGDNDDGYKYAMAVMK